MSKELPEVIRELLEFTGDSDAESWAMVIEAHGAIENLNLVAELWTAHYGICGDHTKILLAYSVAVDLGVRIGRKKAKEDKE